jgi:hypothetical protein
MKSRIRTHKKRTREETPDLSSVPFQGMFEERSFAVQGKQREKSHQPDMKTSLMRAERYGHHLDRMQPTGFQATQAVQLMGKNKPNKKQQPSNSQSNKSNENLAQKHKEQEIKQYLDLLDHLAGETKGRDEVSGGHLWSAMEEKWKTQLQKKREDGDVKGVWELEWTLGQRTPKNSTMFPKSWTKQNLQDELLGSSLVNKQRVLRSGILIKKSGKTFYPIAITEKECQSSENKQQGKGKGKGKRNK